MELTQNDIELLDRFFSGQLKGEELRNLQERMKDPEFAAEVQSYHLATQAIRAAGQVELRASLASIHKEVDSKNDFKKYRPSYKGGSGIGGTIIAGMIIGFIAIGYHFFSDKISIQKLEKTFPSENTIDTVYHYRVKRDTIIQGAGERTSVKRIIKTRVDTFYVRGKNIPQPAKMKETKNSRSTNSGTFSIVKIDTSSHLPPTTDSLIHRKKEIPQGSGDFITK